MTSDASPREALARSIEEHDAPRPGEAVLALVSGGPDSMALMHLLADAHDGRVEVLTLDHGLRAEAAAECALVLERARALGLRAHHHALGVAAGSGVQQRARDARYRTARAVAAERGCDVIAVAHTRDDQAETVLMRMARGAGTAGAAGMRFREGDLVRPLLGVAASATRRWCAEAGSPVVDDPSNRDPAFARVHVRHLLGDIETRFPGAAVHIAALAADMHAEADLVGELADQAVRRCITADGCSITALLAEPAPIRGRVIRHLLLAAGAPPDRVDRAAVARVMEVATGKAGGTEVGGVRVVKAPDRVLALKTVDIHTPGESPLPVPGEVVFGGVRVRAAMGVAPVPTEARVGLVRVGSLRVRAPRDGDRLPLTSGGRARLGRLLAQDGVPAAMRSTVPVIVDGDRPIWVAGHRADPAHLAPCGQRAVVLEVAPA
ncbi:MAG: tRNA lysidine(34) synthetase TilS [Thermoleophilia bacterium]